MSGTSSSSSIAETAVAAGPAATVTEQAWFDFVYLVDPPAASKADPDAVGTVTKERVSDSLIDELKTRPMSTKLPPIGKERTNVVYELYPFLRKSYEQCMTERNCLIDLHVDVLRQHADRGFAEVGVHFADDGVKRIFILAPAASTTTTTPSRGADAEADKQGNGGGGGGAGRSRTTMLVGGGFSGFAAIVFALLVVLLSCLLMSGGTKF